MSHDFLSVTDKGPLLYQAIKEGDIEKVSELLSDDVPVYTSIKDLAGISESPIILVTKHPEPAILIKLLEQYSNDINERDKSFVLYHAAENGYQTVITTLLNQCDNDIDVDYKALALVNAARNGHGSIVTALLTRCHNDISRGAKGWALVNAAKKGYIAIVTALLERCNDIDVDDKGLALCKAALNGHEAIVNTLLERCGNEISLDDKGRALPYAAESGDLGVLNALLADESVLALAASNNNAALRAAQMERNGTNEGTEERARYDAVIARLMEIPAVAQLAAQQSNQENDLADIVNFAENSMQSLTKNEMSLVNHLKSHYAEALKDKTWDGIRAEILSYLESEYQKSPSKDGYHCVWMLEDGARKPIDFIPADTIGFYPNGDECEVSWKSLEGTLNQKTVSMSDVLSIYKSASKENFLHQESQDADLVKAIIKGLDIPAHPRQDNFLPLEYTPNLPQSALTAYYRHAVHNAWRYLSDSNPWMSAQASFVEALDNGLRHAILSDADKVLISYFWLALCDESVTLEERFTIEGNKSVFAATIAEVNRGHNCDERALYVGNIGSTRADDLQADRPSCSYGVTKRLLQSEYGHPYINCPEARTLDLEIIRERMESLLIKPKSEEKAPDNLIDRLNKLNEKELTYVQQQISDICYMNDYDKSKKVALSHAETAQLNSVINTPEEQLTHFIEGTKLWFGKERIEQEHDNPKLSTGPSAVDFFKGHTSYVSFIEQCAQKPLVAFSATLWNAVNAQLETMSPPSPIVNLYEVARIGKRPESEDRDCRQQDEPAPKRRNLPSP